LRELDHALDGRHKVGFPRGAADAAAEPTITAVAHSGPSSASQDRRKRVELRLPDLAQGPDAMGKQEPFPICVAG